RVGRGARRAHQLHARLPKLPLAPRPQFLVAEHVGHIVEPDGPRLVLQPGGHDAGDGRRHVVAQRQRVPFPVEKPVRLFRHVRPVALRQRLQKFDGGGDDFFVPPPLERGLQGRLHRPFAGRLAWEEIPHPAGRHDPRSAAACSRISTPVFSRLSRAAPFSATPAGAARPAPAYSHSMVAGGFELMSYTTRLTPGTSLMMRRAMASSTSWGSRAHRASSPSGLTTARTPTMCPYVRRPSATPTVRVSVSAANAWNTSRSSPARRSSSVTMASAARTTCRRSSVTSPTTRTASPGPGNGCRHKISSGRPSTWPSRRTSSLNKYRSGSTSSSSISSGKPPTL